MHARTRRAVAAVLKSQQLGLILVLLILGALLAGAAGSHVNGITGARVNNFLNEYTLIQMATDASAFAIMGVGATIVIVSGGIDLSVGAVYALAGVGMALALPQSVRLISAVGAAKIDIDEFHLSPSIGCSTSNQDTADAIQNAGIIDGLRPYFHQ